MEGAIDDVERSGSARRGLRRGRRRSCRTRVAASTLSRMPAVPSPPAPPLDDDDPLVTLDAALARLRAYERDDDTRGPGTVHEAELELDVDAAFERLGSPAHRHLVGEVRARLAASFDPEDEYAPLPGRWTDALVKMIGIEALPDLLDACERPDLVDGAWLGSQLNDLVLRHPGEACPILCEAAKSEGRSRRTAIYALTFLDPEEGPAKDALLAALRDPAPAIRAHAASFIAGGDWRTLPPFDEEIATMAISDPDPSVRRAIAS